MNINKIPVGPFEMNCYIVSDESASDCMIIDAGDEPDKIISYVEGKKYKPKFLFNTHGHIDHTRHTAKIQRYFNIPFMISEKEMPLLDTLKSQGLAFGLEVEAQPVVNSFLSDGQKLRLGLTEFTVLHTPGHSPGSMSLYTDGHIFVGDVLFKDSIGRTDLYGGDYTVLMQSIRGKILPLPDETIVYCGHGPDTTIGREKMYNPFLNPTANPFYGNPDGTAI